MDEAAFDQHMAEFRRIVEDVRRWLERWIVPVLQQLSTSLASYDLRLHGILLGRARRRARLSTQVPRRGRRRR